MLRERYDPMNLFNHIPAVGLEPDAVLSHLDSLLDDDVRLQAVNADRSRRFPHTAISGHISSPVKAILHVLAVRNLSQWSDEQTEQRVSDSLAVRQVCRIYAAKTPDDTTLLVMP